MDSKLNGKRHRRKDSDSASSRSATITRICIVGGGFGGLYTALYLRRFPLLRSERCQITLFEQKNHFLFTPLLYELVTGELKIWQIAPSFKKLLANTNIEFCQQRIQGVDLETRQIKLQGGSCIAYDYLVLAVGGEMRSHSIPGATEYAYPFRTLADAERLKERLQCLEISEQKQIQVAIAGGGPNGVELAGKIADRLKGRGQVILIERGKQILKTFDSAAITAAAYRSLASRGVRVELETSITSIGVNQITLERHGQVDTLPVDLVLWTVGSQSIDWVSQLPCQHNSQGQLLALPTLQLMDYPEVFALGDLADVRNAQGKRAPATAQAAFQQADCAARNIWAAIAGRSLKRFRYLHLGDMLTLGTNAAIVSSFGVTLKGSLACIIRRLIYIQRLPTLPHRLQVLRDEIASWVLKLRRKLAKLFTKKSSTRRQMAANYQGRGKY